VTATYVELHRSDTALPPAASPAESRHLISQQEEADPDEQANRRAEQGADHVWLESHRGRMAEAGACIVRARTMMVLGVYGRGSLRCDKESRDDPAGYADLHGAGALCSAPSAPTCHDQIQTPDQHDQRCSSSLPPRRAIPIDDSVGDSSLVTAVLPANYVVR
jgi:hypothetical protein